MEVIENLGYIPRVGIGGLIEIVLITLVVYSVANAIKGTRAWVLLKGVLGILVAYVVAYMLKFNVIVTIFQSTLLFIGIAVVLVLQPELKRIIEQIGVNKIGVSFKKVISGEKRVIKSISDQSIQEIVKGCFAMSKVKTGVLIVIENNIPLDEYIETGILVNGDISSQLLINIFEKNTPLHDGAVIVRKNKVISATCYLPLSDNREIKKDLGTRHRAAIGISEVSDSVVVVVSEETGKISIARGGVLKEGLDREGLTDELKSIQEVKEIGIRDISITDGISIKLCSLLGSIILWLAIMGAVDPVVTETIRGVGIDVINSSSISEIGKTYELLDGDKVNVEVTGRKSEVDKVGVEDIEVVADLSKLSIVNAVSLDANILSNSDVMLRLDTDVVKVSIEDLVDSEFDINVKEVGELDDAYYISNIKLSDETLVVSGAKSIISKIGKVEVEVDLEEVGESRKFSIEPKIYDKNGEEIDESKVKINKEIIGVEVELYNTKEVKLNIDVNINGDQINYIKDDIEISKESVYIAGNDKVLSEYDSIDIGLDLNIELDDITKSQYIKNIDLSTYLPDGVYILKRDKDISITVNFKEFYIKKLEVSNKDIGVVGLADGLECKFKGDKYSVTIISLTDNLSNIKEPYIDVSGLKEGVYVIGLGISGIGGDTKVYGDTNIGIQIE